MLDIIPNANSLREAAGKGEKILNAVQLAECAGHEELEVIEVFTATRIGKGNHVEREQPSPRGERNRRHIAHLGEYGVKIDLVPDQPVPKPVGRAEAVPAAFSLLLGIAFVRTLGFGEASHLGGDHPLDLLGGWEAAVVVPVVAHVLFLSVAFATLHIMR